MEIILIRKNLLVFFKIWQEQLNNLKMINILAFLKIAASFKIKEVIFWKFLKKGILLVKVLLVRGTSISQLKVMKVQTIKIRKTLFQKDNLDLLWIQTKSKMIIISKNR